MAQVTAAAVKDLREQTGLPMMDCKKALTECDGDLDKAITWLRERGNQVLAKRSDRATDFGRFGIYSGSDKASGAIVELKCESAPVTQNEEFIQLANDLAEALATGPGAATADELLDQPCPSQDGKTLRDVKDDMFNRIREVFNIGRMQRIETPCGAYVHNAGTVSGVLLSVDGANDDLAKDICMHIAAMRPAALSVDDLDAEVVEKERGILREAALKEGKPENIVDKMVDGRMRNYFAEQVLTEQPFVKEDKKTVGKIAEEGGLQLKQFVHWELGKE
ncbi:MAG TPA: translation elongation factor Ts [Planctomycetaceae bacterium]|nr:translation elongation factor Ts [Blastopirellula sp.]HAY82705.1 translation elongation factor Ts [Planctomycetaceae bacterium]